APRRPGGGPGGAPASAFAALCHAFRAWRAAFSACALPEAAAAEVERKQQACVTSWVAARGTRAPTQAMLAARSQSQAAPTRDRDEPPGAPEVGAAMLVSCPAHAVRNAVAAAAALSAESL